MQVCMAASAARLPEVHSFAPGCKMYHLDKPLHQHLNESGRLDFGTRLGQYFPSWHFRVVLPKGFE